MQFSLQMQRDDWVRIFELYESRDFQNDGAQPGSIRNSTIISIIFIAAWSTGSTITQKEGTNWDRWDYASEVYQRQELW